MPHAVIETCNITFKSAFQGTVKARPSWSPSSDSFRTTRWWPWVSSVMVTVERFSSKFASSSSSSVFGCLYTLAVWGNFNTFFNVKHIGLHFTSNSLVLKCNGSLLSRNRWTVPLQSTPSMPHFFRSPTLLISRTLKRMVFGGTFCPLWSKASLKTFSAYKVHHAQWI